MLLPLDDDADASAAKKRLVLATSPSFFFLSVTSRPFETSSREAKKIGHIPTRTAILVDDPIRMKMAWPRWRPEVGFGVLHPSKVPGF